MSEYESRCTDLLNRLRNVPPYNVPVGIHMYEDFDGTIIAELDVKGKVPRARFVGTVTNPAWELV